MGIRSRSRRLGDISYNLGRDGFFSIIGCLRSSGIKYLIASALLLCVAVLYIWNPEEAEWLPKCPFHLLTGLDCPACGSQRAVYSLLHLHMAEALKYNLFMVISIPFGILIVLTTWFDPGNRMDGLRNFCYNKYTVTGYVILFFVWWIARNILGI